VTGPVDNQRLRAVREYVGLGIADAAEAGGLPEHELAAIEDGSTTLDDLVLQRLGRVYGLRTSYFTASEDELRDEAVVVLGRLAGELAGQDHDEALRFAAYLRHALDD
jgi:transcriptional regulator with XRE-family HTH domain